MYLDTLIIFTVKQEKTVHRSEKIHKTEKRETDKQTTRRTKNNRQKVENTGKRKLLKMLDPDPKRHDDVPAGSGNRDLLAPEPQRPVSTGAAETC